MKNKNIKKSIIASVSALTFLSLSIPFAVFTANAVNDVKIWTAPNTLKVMQNKHDYMDNNNNLSIKMAKNEVEGAQFVITPEKDVKSYNITLNDLTCGDDVISAEDINIWVQGYVDIKIKSNKNFNEDFPIGKTPDYMVPMDKIVEYGENKITAGCNQGITVEVETSFDTKPGVYTGNIEVDVDGKNHVLPINVEVWNVDIHNNSKSIFVTQRRNLNFGVLDSTIESQDASYSMLLDYKINPQYVPGTEISPDEMIKYLDKYWDHPNFSTYAIAVLEGRNNQGNMRQYEYYLKSLAKHSTPERNYLEKLSVYVGTLDEPWRQNAVDKVEPQLNSLKNVGEKIIREFNDQNFYGKFNEEADDFKKELESSIRNIQLVVTDIYRDEYKDTDVTLCPLFDKLASDDQSRMLDEHAQKHNNEKWWYGCVQPKYPYPSYQIDDSLIGPRAVGWMQKQYDIVGNLYWCTNNFNKNFVDVRMNQAVDSYHDPNRTGSSYQADANGDGFLVYPGTKYGIKEPLPSLRLMAIRDGNDDYDLLCALEEKYKALESYYGVGKGDFSLDNTIKAVYDMISNNVEYVQDCSRIYQAREIISNLIEFAENDVKLCVKNTSLHDGQATTEFYVDAGCKVNVNGKVLNGENVGNGLKFVVKQNLDKVENNLSLEFEKNNQKYEFNQKISNKFNKLFDFSKASNSFDGLTVTKGSSYVTNTSSKTLSFDAVSQGKTLIEKEIFRPGFKINLKALGVDDIDNLDCIMFDITNKSKHDDYITIGINSKNDDVYKIQTIFIKAGESKRILIKNIGIRYWKFMKDADSIIIQFENTDAKGNLLPSRAYVMSEFYASKFMEK